MLHSMVGAKRRAPLLRRSPAAGSCFASASAGASVAAPPLDLGGFSIGRFSKGGVSKSGISTRGILYRGWSPRGSRKPEEQLCASAGQQIPSQKSSSVAACVSAASTAPRAPTSCGQGHAERKPGRAQVCRSRSEWHHGMNKNKYNKYVYICMSAPRYVLLGRYS